MNVHLLIANTEKAIAAEEKKAPGARDTSKLSALYSDLDAYKKTKHSIEKHETEEGDEEDEEEDEAEAAGDETDRQAPNDSDDSDDNDDDSDDDDEEDEEEDEEEEEEAATEEEEEASANAANAVLSAASSAGVTSPNARKAIRRAVKSAVHKALAGSRASRVYAVVRRITGKRSANAIEEALKLQASNLRDARSKLKVASKESRRNKRSAIISKALQERRITPFEAKELRKKTLAFVEQTLEMRVSAVVNTEDDAVVSGQPGATRAGGSVPAAIEADIDRMVADAKTRGIVLNREELIRDFQKKEAEDPGGHRRTREPAVPASNGRGRVI